MKPFDWNEQKNAWLRHERGVTFEEVVYHIAHGGLLDTIVHPHPERFAGQRVFLVNIEDYVYLVPFVENEQAFFLKTIIPSRKMTRQYLGDKPS